ncbi:hypothetical protein LCGC14_0700390 [marine sediment metagenome]|uniref:Polysaccharide lyase n=2 Tax=root TaxID=1 RepID=A0A831R239_9GAMM|nr:hypothetical protein [Marinobacter antarcticus]HDZ15128.1 hypothetical protein [Pricia sp.]HEA52672.1 hypothetical protein [Marinobacter antarcticus]
MNKFKVALTAAGLFTLCTFANGDMIVSDSFESGDLYTTSAYGFKWLDTMTTSIVTADTEVFVTSPVTRPAPKTSRWEAKTGDHAMMLRYNAGRSWTEQRFVFDEPQPEIWMSFWLRVPTNYTHPKVKGASDNQKLFRLWMDGYGNKGDGTTLGMSFRGNGNGGSYFFAKIAGGGDKGKVPFISVPGDRGKWMHLIIHADSESTPGASDGVMEVWRKWEGDIAYTKTHDFKDQPIKLSSSVKGFTSGYLMGWANAVYPVDTEFLIDDFKLSTSSLLSTYLAPNSPSELSIK